MYKKKIRQIKDKQDYDQVKKKTFYSKRRSLNFFRKNLNTVAEKKMRQYNTFSIPVGLASGDGGLNTNYGLIKSSIPIVVGAASNERIGNKIFVRYIKATLIIVGGPNDYCSGQIGLMFAKEKKPQSASDVSLTQIFQSSLPVVSPTYVFKETFSKMKIDMLPIQSINAMNLGIVESNVPYQYVIKRTYRIMKELTYDRTGNISIPDIYLRAFSFAGLTGITGAGHTQNLWTVCTYTDV